MRMRTIPGIVRSPSIGRQTGGVANEATSRLERLAPWLLRLAWIGVLVAGGPAIDGADAPSGDVVTYVAFGGWFAAVCAMAIPAVVSLTATRLLVPLAVPVALLSSVAGADAVPGVSFVALTLLATTIAYSAVLGRSFVQASAYGEEDRHLLRSPAAYAFAAGVSWAIWAAATLGATLALADGRWVIGVVLVAIAIAGSVLGWPRWHRLARRWLVVVPIGLVIHDQLVLAETVMLREHPSCRSHRAGGGTRARDLHQRVDDGDPGRDAENPAWNRHPPACVPGCTVSSGSGARGGGAPAAARRLSQRAAVPPPRTHRFARS
jgi:hypothetical protein